MKHTRKTPKKRSQRRPLKEAQQPVSSPEYMCVAVLCTDGVEEFELLDPVEALKEAGAHVSIVSPKEANVHMWNGQHPTENIEVDVTLDDADVSDFDALVLPGGALNVDQLRSLPDAVGFVKRFALEKKPIAAICHGAWLLADAGLARDRRISSSSSLKNDLLNAGADWAEEDIMVDEESGGLITSRCHDDLYEFNARMVDFFEAAISLKKDVARPRTELRTREGTFTPGALLE